MRKTAWSTCKSTGKRAFRTAEDAEQVLMEARRKRSQLRRHVPRVMRQERRAYQCDWCSGWHVTSMEEVPA